MKRLILCGALMLFGTPSLAQSVPVQSRVVSSCGSASYTAGSNAPLTQDTTGVSCTSTGGGGGTSTVTGSGSAGTPAAGVITVQGISGGTNLPVSQATAANLNATVVGTGTFADQNTQTPSSTVGITTQSCTTACASTLLSGAHAAYGISASATVTGWVLVYDATTCSANGTVTPKKAYAYTVANSTITVSWGDLPTINSTGIAVCFSTSGPYTATSSATAYISLDYK